MSQKTITLVLILVVIGGLAWYVNKTFKLLGSESDNHVTSNVNGASMHTKPSLVYAKFASTRDIYLYSGGETKRLFTDADEKEKVLKYSNIDNMKVLAVMGENYDSKSGTLYEIDLNNGQKKLLQKEFSLPLSLSLNKGAQKIAYTRFSNIENNFGFTLYIEEKDGDLRKKVYNSIEEIKSPVWRSFSQLDYIKSENSKYLIMEYRDTDNQSSEIFKSDDIIDVISPTEKGIWFSIRKYGNSKGEIGIIGIGNKISIGNKIYNSKKESESLFDFEGGVANFIYPDSNNQVGYIIAQYPTGKIDEFTSGQAFIYNLDTFERQSINKCNQILGWED